MTIGSVTKQVENIKNSLKNLIKISEQSELPNEIKTHILLLDTSLTDKLNILEFLLCDTTGKANSDL